MRAGGLDERRERVAAQYGLTVTRVGAAARRPSPNGVGVAADERLRVGGAR